MSDTKPATSIGTMPQSNIAMIRRVVMEIQQDANYALIDELMHPDFKNYTTEASLPADRSGVHAVMQYLHSAFANIQMHIDHCVADEDVIATNKTLTGDHVGTFMGVQGDGKRKMVRIMDFVTVKDGLIYEHWACVRPAVEV